MGEGQPFMYNAVSKQDPNLPYKPFDPRAHSRSTLAAQSPRVKQKLDGPLVAFNVHPDAYSQAPYGNANAQPMSRSTKERIVTTRWIQFALRLFELLGATGSLAVFIMIKNINATIGWVIRIPPGFAILHTAYACYHLSRKATARTPGSTATYMGFAAAFDATLTPFYGFSAYFAAVQYGLLKSKTGEWSTLLPQGTAIMPTLTGTAFLCTIISGGLHLISLGLSIYLCIVFRKIVQLPPDMNPLESHLTARHHKRNKSNLSSVSTTSLTEYEKRITIPLESRRHSGTPYESDLDSRSPTIPFLHTRTGSIDSFHTSHSRDSRSELPSRQYQVVPSNTSREDLSLKRGIHTNTPPRSPLKTSTTATYAEVSLDDDRPRSAPSKEAWFKAENLINASSAYPKLGNKNSRYAPLKQGSVDLPMVAHHDANAPGARKGYDPQPSRIPMVPPPRSPARNSMSPPKPPPHVAVCRPESPPQKKHFDSPRASQLNVLKQRDSPKSFMTANSHNASRNTTPTKLLPNPFTKSRILTNIPLTATVSPALARPPSSAYSGDLADASTSDVSSVSSYNRNSEYNYTSTSDFYKVSSVRSKIRELNNKNNGNKENKTTMVVGHNEIVDDDDDDEDWEDERPRSTLSYRRDSTLNMPAAMSPESLHQKTFSFTASSEILNASDKLKTQLMTPKGYGDLRPATPPILIGIDGSMGERDVGERGSRNVSSGIDWAGNESSGTVKRFRDVSGKIVEEGRAGGPGGGGWARLRRVSGLGHDGV